VPWGRKHEPSWFALVKNEVCGKFWEVVMEKIAVVKVSGNQGDIKPIEELYLQNHLLILTAIIS